MPYKKLTKMEDEGTTNSSYEVHTNSKLMLSKSNTRREDKVTYIIHRVHLAVVFREFNVGRLQS